MLKFQVISGIHLENVTDMLKFANLPIINTTHVIQGLS